MKLLVKLLDAILGSLFDENEINEIFGESNKPKYTDLGPVIGTCSFCGREIYGISRSLVGELALNMEFDKAESDAMWCPTCKAWYCLGDVNTPQNNYSGKCPKCGNDTIVHTDI